MIAFFASISILMHMVVMILIINDDHGDQVLPSGPVDHLKLLATAVLGDFRERRRGRNRPIVVVVVVVVVLQGALDVAAI